jgi:dimethylamine monooxygenase subunit A
VVQKDSHPLHLPFMDGAPRFDVGLKPIDLDTWLQPDDEAVWLVEKNHLIDHRTDEVFQSLGLSLPGQIEAAHLVSQAVGTNFDWGEPPLLAASRLVSDDLVLMELRDGAWTNTALCLVSPTFFSASEAIGKSLFGLHRPVPNGDPDLAGRISRVFSNLREDLILERHNWTVQWSATRYSPSGEPLRKAAELAPLTSAKEQLHLRVERQTIRRLPETGAVLFTIRIRLTPLWQLLEDPLYKQAFQNAWHEAPPPVRAYKKWQVLERHVEALLSGDLPKS